MAVPSSTRHGEWQPGRVPKLTYRKPLPSDESDNIAPVSQDSASLTCSLSKTDSNYSSDVKSSARSSILPGPRPKKKGSFFSGLFTKEPTLTALAQVEAEIKAKHGAATPQRVPLVSSRKMPEHVPKVNSKWDGVPESVRHRDKQEKQKRRISQQTSLAPPQSARSRSTEGSVEDFRYNSAVRSRRNSDAGLRQDHESPIYQIWGPGSVYSESSGGSRDNLDSRGRTASVPAQSLRSPSGSNLPEITSFFPHHENNTVPPVPQRWQSINSSNSYSTKASHQSRSETFNGISEHSLSPITSPRDLSPVTPSFLSDSLTSPDKGPSSKETTHSGRAGGTKPKPVGAFLAGEAKPLELDDEANEESDVHFRRYQIRVVDRLEADVFRQPDSSRTRIGSQAPPVPRKEAAPWEAQASDVVAPSIPVAASRNKLPMGFAVPK